MNLAAINSFCTVVKMGSISKAAKKLEISQPALSLQIQALEKHFNGILLERSNRGVKPTQLGLVVYNYGKKVASIISNLDKEIERCKAVKQDYLSVSAASTMGCYILPCLLNQFKEAYKAHGRLRLVTTNTDNVLESVLERGSDLGMVEGPLESSALIEEGLSVKDIAADELLLIAARGGRWDGAEVSLGELKNLPLILREQGSGIRRSVERALREKGIELADLDVVMELNNIAAVKSSVDARQGLSFLPRLAISRKLRQGMFAVVKVKGLRIPHTHSFIYFPEKLFNALVCNFIKFTREKVIRLCLESTPRNSDSLLSSPCSPNGNGCSLGGRPADEREGIS